MPLNGFSADVQELVNQEVPWIKLLPRDPRTRLLESGETFTIYRTLTDLLDLPATHPDVIQTRQELLEDPVVQQLVKNLSDWEQDLVTGHQKPTYLPNQLWLLLDWGLRPEDDPHIQTAIDTLLAHQDPTLGQFLAYSRIYNRKTKTKTADWTSVLCDHNLITSILLLAGLKDDPRVQCGLTRMDELLVETSQGMGWKCVPGLWTNFRGPGRVNDVCPMAVVDALRGYWVLPETKWPPQLMEAGKTLLNCWTNRAVAKPYMFGHGRHFRTPRAPFIWYNIGTVLDAVSHYHELVRTSAFRELLAVSQLTFEPTGEMIPRTIFRYFQQFSFGQKKQPSPWMTLFFSRIYKRAVDFDPKIIDAVKQIDGRSLKGSKGGPKAKNPNKA